MLKFAALLAPLFDFIRLLPGFWHLHVGRCSHTLSTAPRMSLSNSPFLEQSQILLWVGRRQPQVPPPAESHQGEFIRADYGLDSEDCRRSSSVKTLPADRTSQRSKTNVSSHGNR
jgi:hypothetical protein